MLSLAPDFAWAFLPWPDLAWFAVRVEAATAARADADSCFSLLAGQAVAGIAFCGARCAIF
jgi:hypothetical protein